MNKIKETMEKAKCWIKENRGKLVAGGVGICLATAGLILYGRSRRDNSTDIPEDVEEPVARFGPGRLCDCVFFVKETGEELGRTEVYESYAKDMLDIYCDE